MSSYLRATHLLDLCTQSISYDRQVQSACKAFDEQMFEIIDDTDQVIMIPNIMNIDDETLIDILAWQFHVDFYDTTKDLEFRKRLVQMSIIWHKTKGTLALVQDVIDTYWPGGAHIEEWYQYKDPLPPNYPTAPPDTLICQFGLSDVNVALNRFEITAHGLTNNQVIRFHPYIIGHLPAPVIEGVWYYVRNAATDNFQIAVMTTGPLVTLLDTGSGVNQIFRRASGESWHDRYRFRITLDQELITPEDQIAVLTLIDRYKPVSRWCEGLFRAVVSRCDIGVTGMLLRFIYRESDHPDDWHTIPEPPPPPWITCVLNRMLGSLTATIDTDNPVRGTLIKPTGALIKNVTGKVAVKSNVSKTVGPATLSAHIPTSVNPHKVHFVYLIPSDKTDRASARIAKMVNELRHWMRWRMGNGKTFTPYDQIVQVYQTDHNSAWYREHYIGGGQTSGTLQVGKYYHIVNYQAGDNFTNVGASQNATNIFFQATGTTPANWTHGSLVCETSGYYWNNTLADLSRYAGGGFYQFYHTWFTYIDCDPAPGQYAGGTGGGYTSGVCVLGATDLSALLGELPLGWTVCREIGGAGHEYLHTHSAPHAEPEYWNQSIMGIAYNAYSECILQPSLIALLNANPFYTVQDNLPDLEQPMLCYFDESPPT